MRTLRLLRKNFILAKLMRQISPIHRPLDYEKEMKKAMDRIVSGKKSRRVLAEEALFDLVRNDPDLTAISAAHGIDPDLIPQLYRKLVLSGAGQWVRGAYVPAASIATNPGLDFFLRHVAAARQADVSSEPIPTDPDFWRSTAFTMAQFFER